MPPKPKAASRKQRRAAATDGWLPLGKRTDPVPVDIGTGVPIWKVYARDDSVDAYEWRASWPSTGTVHYQATPYLAPAFSQNEWHGMALGASARAAAAQAATEQDESGSSAVGAAAASGAQCLSISAAKTAATEAKKSAHTCLALNQRLLAARLFRLPTLLNGAADLDICTESVSDAKLAAGNATLISIIGDHAEQLTKDEVRRAHRPCSLAPGLLALPCCPHCAIPSNRWWPSRSASSR